MKPARILCCPSLRHAFTLVELLVASAITAVLATLLLGITQNILDSYRRTVAGATVERDGRFALDRMNDDLAALVMPRPRGAESLHAAVESVNGATSVWLAFLSNATDADPDGFASSPRALSYRVAYQDPVSDGGARPAFALYRSVGAAAETLDDALASADLRTDFWQSRPTADLEDFLVGDIVDFRIRYCDPDTGDWIALRNPGDSLRVGRDGYTATGGASRSQPPTALELSVTTISREGAIRLREGAITLEEAMLRFGRTFTRQMALNPGRR